MNTKTFMLIFLGFVSLAGCQNESDRDTTPGRFSVAFKPEANAQSGGEMNAGRVNHIDEISNVVVTIENFDGTLVHDLMKLTLVQFGDQFVSEEIELLPGAYRITKFMVRDADNNVLYATPLAGSPLAHLVEHPLPLNYTVSAGAVTNVPIEVVGTEDESAEDFGYAVFSFTVIETKEIEFDVTIANSDFTGAVEYTLDVIAKDAALGNTEWSASFDLSGSSAIRIPVSYEHYTFKVSKEGYLPHIQHYLIDDLSGVSRLSFELLPGDPEAFITYQTTDGGLKIYFPKDRCKLYTRVDVAEGFRIAYAWIDRDATWSGAPTGQMHYNECSPFEGPAIGTSPVLCNPINAFGNIPFTNVEDYCEQEIDPILFDPDEVVVAGYAFIEYYRPGESSGDGFPLRYVVFYHAWPGDAVGESSVPDWTSDKPEASSIRALRLSSREENN
jgi:hypothetical protein